MAKAERKRVNKIPKDLEVGEAVSAFDLQSHLSIPEEAERFELDTQTVETTIAEVQGSAQQAFVSLKMRVAELRDKLLELMNREVRIQPHCQICKTRTFDNYIEASAHIRWHWINQQFDPKLSAQTLDRLEQRLFPLIEAELREALPLDERSKIVQAIERSRAERMEGLNRAQDHLRLVSPQDGDTVKGDVDS